MALLYAYVLMACRRTDKGVCVGGGGVFDDNCRIIFCQFSIKTYIYIQCICCRYSLESPHRGYVVGTHRGDSNEYPQHMFLWRNKQNHPLIITTYPPYLFHWVLTGFVKR